MKRAVTFVLCVAVVCALAPGVAAQGGKPPATQGQKSAPPAQKQPATQPAVAPAAAPAAPAKAKLTQPMKGTAVINILKPVTKVVGSEVVTTLTLKNASYGAIGGLRVDEYWYDKAGNLLAGDSKRLPKLVQPDEVVTVELRTPRDPKMNRNAYQFSHVNGSVRADMVKKLE